MIDARSDVGARFMSDEPGDIVDELHPSEKESTNRIATARFFIIVRL